MSDPAVSVVLPTFNRLEFLRIAIESVRQQTFADIELVVADDGSDAPTREWLAAELRAPRERLVQLEHSGNPARVRNAALACARGTCIAFLDSDDRWLPDKLATQLAFMRESGARWSYTAIRRIDAAGARLAGDQHRGWIPYDGAIFDLLLQQRVGLALPTVMAQRDLIEAAGGFDPSLDVHEDFDLWLRLASLAPVGVVPGQLTEVRCHDRHYSDDGLRSLRAWDRVLIKQEARPLAPTSRRRLRAERARTAARLARHNALRGDAPAVFHVLRESFARGWAQPRWWRGAAAAAWHLLGAART